MSNEQATFNPDTIAQAAGRNYQIDYKFFDKILTNNDFKKMNQLECMKRMYEIMYVYYTLTITELRLERDDYIKRVANEYADVIKLRQELHLCQATIAELRQTNVNQEPREVTLVNPVSNES